MKKCLILCAMAIFVSCTHDFEPIEIQKEKEKNFENNFNSTFGVSESDYANHDWGMNLMPLVDMTNSSAKTRAAQPNGNQWGTHDDNDKYIDYPKPAAITEEERAAVLAVFNQKGAEKYEPLVHWKNFFVQQVYTGPNGSKMNELATTVDYTVTTNVISWWPYQAETIVNEVPPFDDIINNFNAGNCNAWDGCMLMWNSATEDFSFKTSQSGGERIYGHWRMEEINGNYYVGFDHEAWRQAPANANEEDKRDYVYNDWIVKIVPGAGEIIPESVERVRVMCEDLSSNRSDFDYNDVVFDVRFIKKGNVYYADILLQAAGGELPLTIGQGNEVHGKFGVSQGTMVNTYEGRHSEYSPVSFIVQLPKETYNNAYEAINDLPVIVKLSSGAVQLTINQGKPAEMIIAPVETDWSDERVPLQDKYSLFVDWIQDPSVKWYKVE